MSDGNFSNDLMNATIANDSYYNEDAPNIYNPIRDGLEIVVPITFAYILMFLSGVIGNISTCIVIARNKSMHTATNYYLFSLAISDLLLLLFGLPDELYSRWYGFPYIWGESFCVIHKFCAEVSTNASVLTITAFTVERYVAICHPFVSHKFSKLSRAIKFIIGIWLVAMGLAVVPAMSFGIVYLNAKTEEYDEQPPAPTSFDDPFYKFAIEHSFCTVPTRKLYLSHAFAVSGLVLFFVPMSVITILYVLIGMQLRKSTVGPSRGGSVKLKHRVYKPVVTNNTQTPQTQTMLVLNDEEGAEKLQNMQEEEGRKNFNKNAQATKHVVKMLVAVVVAFFICWAPFHAQRLVAVYGKGTKSLAMQKAYEILTEISGVFYYFSTTINPVLYHIMSLKFREAYKNTFKQCFRRHRPRLPLGGRCYATLSVRSSQVNSHSNTDSYSHQSSTLRYLDAEMARLHDARRPLVVSFRRKPTRNRHANGQMACNGGNTTISNLQSGSVQLTQPGSGGGHRRSAGPHQLDTSLQEVLDGLRESRKSIMGTADDYDEAHNLQPTHICPLTLQVPSLQTLHSDNLELNGMLQVNRPFSSKSSSSSLYFRKDDGKDSNLSKSCTMPDISKTANQDLLQNNTKDIISKINGQESNYINNIPEIRTCDFDNEENDNTAYRKNGNVVSSKQSLSELKNNQNNEKYLSNIISNGYSDNIVIHVN